MSNVLDLRLESRPGRLADWGEPEFLGYFLSSISYAVPQVTRTRMVW